MPHVDGEDDGVGYGIRGKSHESYGVVGETESEYIPIAGVVGRSDKGIWHDNIHQITLGIVKPQ